MPLDHSRSQAVYPRASDGPSLIPCGIALLFDLAPCGVYRAATVASDAVRSYRTFSPLPLRNRGGLFSVALSVGSPLPRVTRHTALWSSDFPRSSEEKRDCLADSGADIVRWRWRDRQLLWMPPNTGAAIYLARASVTAAAGLLNPSISRSLTSSAWPISGCSRINCFAFSRP